MLAYMLALLDVPQSIRNEAPVVHAHDLQIPALWVAMVQQVQQRQHRPTRHAIFAGEQEGVRCNLHACPSQLSAPHAHEPPQGA